MPIVDETKLNQFAKKVFDELYKIDKFAKIIPHIQKNETSGYHYFDDGEIVLTSLFLVADKSIVESKNSRKTGQDAWFTNPFRVNEESWYLTTQWNGPEFSETKEGRIYSLSMPRLNHLCEKYYSLSIEEPHQWVLKNKIEANVLNHCLQEEMDEGCIQKIFFGAPGTGKSHKIDNGLFENEDGSTYGLMSVSQDCKFRTTFHPDYDYAQFVGSYKPKKEGSSITYSFVPQVFAKAYIAAWNKFIAAGKKSSAENQVYLVIEEINRGNCAQVFGDLFQLLDRDENGYSSYEINADADFAEWIEKQLDSSAAPQNDIPDGIRSGCKLRLPPNFNILATMNTSDQSLFPMDSAFKRRFDWVYVPIDYEKIEANFDIAIGDKRYKWLTFIKNVNERILDLTESEDKQLGEFFIKPAPGDGDVISKERFLGKVMFYLWNEVCKDEHRNGSFFRIKDQNPNREDFFTYQDLYKVGGDSTLIAFMNWIVPSDESTTDA